MPLIRPASSVAADVPPAVAEPERDALLADLSHPDADTRRGAARQLGRLGETGRLLDRLPVETDLAVREAILTSLIRRGGEEAARGLVGLLRSEDPALRNAVIETLQSMGAVVLPELERLLDDADSDQRIFAVNVLQSLRHESVPDLALRVALTDPHVNVCAAAVDVLADLGRPEMVARLETVAPRFPDHKFLAFAVRAAAKRIG